MKSKLIVVKGAGEAREVLCFNRTTGQHWRPLERERKLRFPSTRMFDTPKGADLAKDMLGGDTVEVLSLA